MNFWYIIVMEGGCMNLKENLKKLKLRNFMLLTIAGIINSFGVTMFTL